jgi:hypothetical protein
MSVDRKNEATDVEDDNLSRRSFLFRLAVVSIGSATAMSLTVNAADAAAESELASGAKDLTNSETWPDGKKAEVVQQVDPNDPLQHFNQPYYRHRRRVARRVYRRTRRYTRRAYRRYWRRGYYY